jgi:hypothetical protein
VEGVLDRNAWNYYSFNLESENTLVVRVTEARGPGVLQDCDLYVRRGQRPTLVQFDYSDAGRDANSTVSIPTPMGLYWVGIRGFQRCAYTAVLEEGSAVDCVNNCSGHGVCDGGQCTCSPPFSGEDCSVTEGSLVSGVSVTGTVSINQWQYFNYSTTSGFASFQLMENDSIGAMWLFVDLEQNPTLANHDYQDVDFDRPFHSINVNLPNSIDTPQNFYVGVYGDPVMASTTPKSFTLAAWSPSSGRK